MHDSNLLIIHKENENIVNTLFSTSISRHHIVTLTVIIWSLRVCNVNFNEVNIKMNSHVKIFCITIDKLFVICLLPVYDQFGHSGQAEVSTVCTQS